MVFNACDDTDYKLSEATPEFLLAASEVKKWELIDPTVEIGVGDKMPVIKPTPPEDLVDNGLGYFYFIFLDKTIRFQDGYGETADDVSLEHGRWDFVDAGKQAIKVTWEDRVEIWNIKVLTLYFRDRERWGYSNVCPDSGKSVITTLKFRKL